MPRVRIRESDLAGKDAPVEVLRQTLASEVLAQDGNDFRGQPVAVVEVATVRLADSELQKRRFQLRDSPRSESHSENRVVHALAVASCDAGRSNRRNAQRRNRGR